MIELFVEKTGRRMDNKNDSLPRIMNIMNNGSTLNL
jgi:hypothetical protein